MSRSLFVLVGIAAACAACSSSVGNDRTTTGSGGAGTSSSAASGTGGDSASSTAATTTAATTGAGGGGGAGRCADPTNPMFGSCVVTFLAGCYAPDESGTCTDTNGVVAWSDGSKYVTKGPMPGLYGPGDAAPCIAMTFGAMSITGTKGGQTMTFEDDAATQTATITCPDGSTFTATNDQVTAFNRCEGLNCPP